MANFDTTLERRERRKTTEPAGVVRERAGAIRLVLICLATALPVRNWPPWRQYPDWVRPGTNPCRLHALRYRGNVRPPPPRFTRRTIDNRGKRASANPDNDNVLIYRTCISYIETL